MRPPAAAPPAGEPERLLDTWGRRNRRLPDHSCRECGKLFHPRHAESKYCSRPCMWANNGGHNKKPSTWWLSQKGYIVGRVWVGDKQRHVKKHRHMMEEHLGRRLRPDEDVHHVNGDKTDNRIENLQILSHEEHAILSNRVRKEQDARAAQHGEE